MAERVSTNIFIKSLGLVLCVLLCSAGALGFCPNACQCDDVMLKIECSDANLDIIPILLNPSTRDLNLSLNRITAITAAFTFYSHLENLDLSRNNIISLGKRNFISQNHIISINLSYNNISSIDKDTFYGLVSLINLELSHNSLKSLHPASFKHLKHLRYIKLDTNRIKVFQANLFSSSPELKVIHACENNLTKLNPRTFEFLGKLENLHLCKNAIEALQRAQFSSLKSLRYLELNENRINFLHEDSFRGLKNLLELNLYGNKISRIPQKLFIHLHKVQKMNIGNNLFEQLKNGTFQTTWSLNSLNISNCVNLREMEIGVFLNLSSLLDLELSRNVNLTNIDIQTFLPMRNMRKLVLSNNGLSVIGEDILKYTSIEYLDLRNNPLVCNCSIEWMKRLLMNTNNTLIDEGLSCITHNAYLDTEIYTLKAYSFYCSGNIIAIISILSVFTFLVTSGFLIIYVRHRFKNRIKTRVQDNWPERIVYDWNNDCQNKSRNELHVKDEDFLFSRIESTPTKSWVLTNNISPLIQRPHKDVRAQLYHTQYSTLKSPISNSTETAPYSSPDLTNGIYFLTHNKINTEEYLSYHYKNNYILNRSPLTNERRSRKKALALNAKKQNVPNINSQNYFNAGEDYCKFSVKSDAKPKTKHIQDPFNADPSSFTINKKTESFYGFTALNLNIT